MQTTPEDLAIQAMLNKVAALMDAIGYPYTAVYIAQGRLGGYIIEFAYDLCEARSLGQTDEQFMAARAQGIDPNTAQGQEDGWLFYSIVAAADMAYCKAIGAAEYQP